MTSAVSFSRLTLAENVLLISLCSRDPRASHLYKVLFRLSPEDFFSTVRDLSHA